MIAGQKPLVVDIFQSEKKISGAQSSVAEMLWVGYHKTENKLLFTMK